MDISSGDIQFRTEQHAQDLWECQLRSSIGTTQSSSQLKDSTDICQTIQDTANVLLLQEGKHTLESSSSTACNGIMGVPISFLDKYCPEQFEIVGNEYLLGIPKERTYIEGKRMYSRIFIKHKKEDEAIALNLLKS